MIVKYKANKKTNSGYVRFRTQNRFTIESQDQNKVRLKSYNTSVVWFETANIDEIEEVK
jgi:hypothetical protein